MNRPVLRDAVAEQIQSKILDGTLRAGDRLPPERELAEKLGVNRSSVREALKKLEQLGLVTSHQGSGTRVCSVEDASPDLLMRLLFLGGRPNLPWIRDFLDLREALAPGIVRLALERASEPELGRVVELCHRAAAAGLPDGEFLDAVLSVHDALVHASHNRAVLQLWNSLRRVLTQVPFQPLRLGTARARGRFLPGLKRLAVAVHARDAETAERTVRDILHRGTELVLEAMRVEPEDPSPERRGGQPEA
jgi:GntR family transcriptional repressor for pyruvate dehydrogenase complex